MSYTRQLAVPTAAAAAVGSTSGSFSTILGIVFVVLKLTHNIAWPWIWVLAPFWAGIALVLMFALVALVAAGVLLWADRR